MATMVIGWKIENQIMSHDPFNYPKICASFMFFQIIFSFLYLISDLF
jgi:hypothetical protein